MKRVYNTVISFAVICFITLNNICAQNPIAWKFQTGNGIHSTPLIADSVVYFGSNDKYFYAVNKNTGTEIWKYLTDYPVNSKATSNDSLVFFESGFRLFALNKATGDEVWNFVSNSATPEIQIGFTDYHHCSPVIYNNTIYFGDGWGNMNAVDIKTGKLTFQYTVQGDSAAIRSTPAIQDDIIYFGTWAGNAYAISLVDSSVVWEYSLPNRRDYYGMITSEMVIKDNILYFGSQHDVYTPLYIETGEPVWSFTDPNQTYLPSGPVFYNDAVIVGTTINTWKIYSLTNGNINWTFNTDGILFVTPAIVDTVLIMNTSNFGGTGTMYMIDIRNGEFINEYHFSNAAPASPVVDGQRLYVGNGDGYLYSFNLNDLIFPTPDTTITIDTTTAEFNYLVTDKSKSVNVLIENKSFVCDDYIISKTLSSNTPEDGIIAVSPSTGHVWANSNKNISLGTVYPEKLAPGVYQLEISVSSKKLPDLIFNKTINIIIGEVSEIDLVNDEAFQVNFYPNPAKEFVTIEISNNPKPVQVTIYDLKGRMVFTEMLYNGEAVWDLNDLNGRKCRMGEYIYRINCGTDEKSGLLSIL